MEDSLTFRLLGPVGVWRDERLLGPATAQQRSVLAALLLDIGKVVSVEQLIQVIWGENPPGSARNAVQGYLSKLRRMLTALPQVTLITSAGGYRLVAAAESVDLYHFRDLVERARHSEPAAAGPLLAEASLLWRGPALADVSDSLLLRTAGAALEEERIAAVERSAEIALDSGRPEELLTDLSALVAVHPLREKLVRLLMSLLERSGRRADALTLFRDTRRRLIDELGIEPGSELQETHRRILKGERTPLSPAAGGAMLPRQLPADVAHFTGREQAMSALEALVCQMGEDSPNTVVLALVEGIAGVGKTALALRFAHRYAAHFSDGQLYVDLHGFDPVRAPLTPREALGRLVRTMGVEPRRIPAELDELAGLYRSLMAGKRMLVLLDNAATAEQVRPLIPGAPTCLVLVTGRTRLRGLVAHDGARPLSLDPLPLDEALELTRRIIGGERVEGEPEAAAELARLCGGLPLALRIAAANVHAHPGRSIADQAARMAVGRRLDALVIEGDEQRTVRTAFDLSYSALRPEVAHAFRHLALLPGAGFTAEATAALMGLPVGESERSLRRLAAAGLVEEYVSGRYRMHDLVAVYCAERARSDQAGHGEARARLFAWYLRTAHAADKPLKLPFLQLPYEQAEPSPDDLRFEDAADALAWLEAERHNLVAAVEHAASHGHRRAAWHLADVLRGFFWLRKYHADWMTVGESGLRAAEAEGDHLARSAMAESLAHLHADLGRHQSAIGFHTMALEINRGNGWRLREANTLCNLGNRHALSGDLGQAITYFTEALTLARVIDWREGEARILGNLGGLCWDCGMLHDALKYCAQSLAALQEFGSQYAHVVPLLNMGCVQLELGDLGGSADAFTRARALCGSAGVHDGEAKCLVNLARVHHRAGHCDQAAETAERALSAIQDVEAGQARVDVLNTLGSVRLELGAADTAVDHHQRALAISRATDNPRGEGEALVGLASAHLHLARQDEALIHAEQALTLMSATGHRVVESQALMALSDIRFAKGDDRQGLQYAARALAIHHATGYSPRWTPRTPPA
ncbi:BTAD domain-containing putative transcriptional regulator [Nonomuraea sp. NPDC050536]|uniref:AfsR/SARP family transcriptional regulator n=1 Tax=Nonomuraea sp. NPDC050536 TaxID=3364366 RepID=UPI0037CB8575